MAALTRFRRDRYRHASRFSRLWTGFAFASSGDGFILGAAPLLAVVIDPRPLAVSAVVAADLFPWLLMVPIAGALADQFESGRLMSVTSLIRASVLFVAGLLVINHRMNLILLISAVFLNASSRAVYYSSLQASVPELVPQKSLERANGILTGTEAAAEHVVGPVVGSATFAFMHSLPFFSDAAAMCLSSLSLVRLRTRGHRTNRRSSAAWEGIRLLFADRRLRVLVIMLSCIAGLEGLVVGILVLVATKDWGVHQSVYGLFLAAGSVGVMPGALLTERFVARMGSALTLLLDASIAAVAYLVMAWSRTWIIAGPAFIVVGFSIGVASVASTSMRQRLTPQELMGRVGAAWRGAVWGAGPIGALAAGSIAIFGGLRLPILLAGILQAVLVVLLARPLMRALPKGGDIDATEALSVISATQPDLDPV